MLVRGQQGERDRQIEPCAVLATLDGREVHELTSWPKVEAGVRDGRADALPRLDERTVRLTDHREAR